MHPRMRYLSIYRPSVGRGAPLLGQQKSVEQCAHAVDDGAPLLGQQESGEQGADNNGVDEEKEKEDK